MKLSTSLVRDVTTEPRLEPNNADEDAWWRAAKPVIWRRLKSLAIAKAAGAGLLAGLVKGVRVLDGHSPWGEWAMALFAGALFFGLTLGFFLFQANNQLEADRLRLSKARRMHRAILAERDAE
jgi:hypothetical protein